MDLPLTGNSLTDEFFYLQERGETLPNTSSFYTTRGTQAVSISHHFPVNRLAIRKKGKNKVCLLNYLCRHTDTSMETLQGSDNFYPRL